MYHPLPTIRRTSLNKQEGPLQAPPSVLALSEEDAASLIQPFTIEEIDKVVKSMKPNTALDGSSVSFYASKPSKDRDLDQGIYGMIQ
jgi:hypothetical protein